MRMISNRCCLIGISLVTILTSGIHAAPYDVIDIGTLGGNKNYAFAINEINEVVGNSNAAAIPSDQIDSDNPPRTCIESNEIIFRDFCDHAYLYSNGTITDLGELNTDGTFAFSINDQSIAVGYAIEIVDDNDPDTTDPFRQRAFVSYSGAAIEPLPYPAESADLPDGVQPQMTAQHIGNDNIVVGYALVELTDPTDDTASISVRRPYSYDLMNDVFVIIPPFVTDDLNFTGNARSSNTSGQIVGWGTFDLSNGAETTRALLWDPQAPETSTELGTLGGFSSQAYDINDNGLIVGISDTNENFFRNETLAFVYDISTGSMTQLPEFSRVSEYTQATAFAINNANQIVGASQSSATTGITSAFLYNVGTSALIDLNNMIPCDSGWNLVIARDINESGHIIGTGTFDGEVRSFLLVPTGETNPTNCTDSGDEGGSSGGSTGMMFLYLLSLILARRFYLLKS